MSGRGSSIYGHLLSRWSRTIRARRSGLQTNCKLWWMSRCRSSNSFFTTNKENMEGSLGWRSNTIFWLHCSSFAPYRSRVRRSRAGSKIPRATRTSSRTRLSSSGDPLLNSQTDLVQSNVFSGRRHATV